MLRSFCRVLRTASLDEVRHLTDARERPIRRRLPLSAARRLRRSCRLFACLKKKYDRVLVAGKVACEAQDEHVLFSDKALLPEDYAPERQDIGRKTLLRFREEILKSKTVVWNGPLGKFENPNMPRTNMTRSQVLSRAVHFRLSAAERLSLRLKKAGAFQKISFVSTGGGAMLEFFER